MSLSDGFSTRVSIFALHNAMHFDDVWGKELTKVPGVAREHCWSTEALGTYPSLRGEDFGEGHRVTIPHWPDLARRGQLVTAARPGRGPTNQEGPTSRGFGTGDLARGPEGRDQGTTVIG